MARVVQWWYSVSQRSQRPLDFCQVEEWAWNSLENKCVFPLWLGLGFFLREEACFLLGWLRSTPNLRFRADKGNCGRRRCSGALNSFFHEVAHHTWYALPHFLRTSTGIHLAGRDHSCSTFLFPTCLVEPWSTLIHTELRSVWREVVFYSFSLVWIRSWDGSNLLLGPCSCSYVNA